MSTPMIEVAGLSRSYGGTVAVRDLSFTAGAGEILGLLGPNGAGKTTTIDMLSTLLSIDGGTATVAGFDVAREPESVRRVIGLAGQSAAVDEKLTARENLRLFGRLYKIPRARLRDRVQALVDQFRLGEFADRPASTYSGGQRRRLDVAAALIAEPPVVFLDEPTTGLDPRSRSELWGAARDLAASGTAVVLTTQYLEEADQLADRIVLVDRGSVVAEGTPAQLKARLERDVLEVRVAADADIERALALLPGAPTTVPGPCELHLPVGDGGERPLSTLRRLEDGGVSIVEFQLRRPTLDDVFLAVTDESAA